MADKNGRSETVNAFSRADVDVCRDALRLKNALQRSWREDTQFFQLTRPDCIA